MYGMSGFKGFQCLYALHSILNIKFPLIVFIPYTFIL